MYIVVYIYLRFKLSQTFFFSFFFVSNYDNQNETTEIKLV